MMVVKTLFSGSMFAVFYTLGMLVKACDRYNVSDDIIEVWRKEG
jgi:hypothetical protein